MIHLRRLTLRSRRAVAARAGLIAFGTIFVLGCVLGVFVGAQAAQRIEAATVSVAKARVGAVRRALEEGLLRHRTALDLLVEMPSVVESSGKEKKAFETVQRLYPDFETVGVNVRRVSQKGLPRNRPRTRRLTRTRGDVHLTGVLRSDWPQRFLGTRSRLGASRSRTVLVMGAGGSLSSGARPLGGLDFGKAGKAVDWSDGKAYLTVGSRLAGEDADLVVVCGVPSSVVAARIQEARNGGVIAGALLGLLAGTVAWIGIAKATRRLSAQNESLERRVAERTAELQVAERSFREIFENVPLGLYQCDPQGRFLRVNPMLAATLGYETTDAAIAALGSLHTLGDTEIRSEFLRRVVENGEARETALATGRADGRTVWLAERARAVRDGSGKIAFIEGALLDVTSQREMEDQLRRIGVTDPLTGLLNRRGLTEAVAAAQLPVSFVAIDVDRFKSYNDTYGHPAGDLALQTVATAIRDTVRASDVVARAGGEEFVVVLSRTGNTGAARVAEAIREAISACENLEERLTVSIGVATATAYDDVDEAFAAADRALYRAKDAGRNRVVLNPAKLA